MKNLTFGERLKLLRNRKNLSQIELAQLIGVSKSSLAMYETDKREPGINTLHKLCRNLEVTGDELLGIEVNSQALEKCSDIDPNEKLLLTGYRQLNDNGKQKICSHLEDLLANPKNILDSTTSAPLKDAVDRAHQLSALYQPVSTNK